MVARDSVSSNSSSMNRNSLTNGFSRLVGDVEAFDQIMSILRIDADELPPLSEDWENDLSGMAVDELAVILERAILLYLVNR